MLSIRSLPFLLIPALLSACGPQQPAHEKPKGDPCHLPYLDGKDHFVAAIDLKRGKGKPEEKNWSKGEESAVDVLGPKDGYPDKGKMHVVLVLTADNPVEWRIDPALAKMTDAVLTAGTYEQSVVGVTAKTPVAHASRELQINKEASCVTMAPLFAENKDASRFKVVNGVVDAMLALGVDRYYEAKEAAKVAIPPKKDPFQVKP